MPLNNSIKVFSTGTTFVRDFQSKTETKNDSFLRIPFASAGLLSIQREDLWQTRLTDDVNMEKTAMPKN